ncbi:stage II sporulation protein P [Paenibacillus aceti]|uniref:Stage II sporulation protein P n=1 Tax=Paenibacillus aceti TaxID=1820010 RepID=A0ABQ1VP86_9BACL|nr:stage II sporulation protein P [Paenibacillus aceti]GGF83502.1 stage II sporulation protein P [Paenibacillus aceti]
MKFKAWNIGKIKRSMMHILAMGRTFLLLSVLAAIFFVLLGTLGIAEKSLNTSPVSSMRGLAASLSSRFFIDMVGMELPHSVNEKQSPAFNGKEVTNFVFQLLTDVNPSDPKSLIAREVPGLGADSPILLRSGSDNHTATAPEDYRPGAGADGSAPDHEGEDKSLPEPDSQHKGGNQTPQDQEPSIKPGNKNIVMIYHSHPHESFNPLLGTDVASPNSSDESKNVGFVGKLLASALEKKGVATLHSFVNYQATESDYNYYRSYKYSRETVKQAMSENGKLQYYFDIHRDSARHKNTTATIDGVNYAQVYFIIGHKNENWRQNEEFANSIHERMKKSYPGISRGVWGKTSAQGNGEYNQSLSPNSILIEIGGVDSSEEELNNTAKVLADIIADIYWESQATEKVDTLAKAGKER